ncbi:MAG: hypothetical protein K0B15_09070 [Lentimicrobium sp.]|nr:hypothetical protein [Lentimicrobium sp.]
MIGRRKKKSWFRRRFSILFSKKSEKKRSSIVPPIAPAQVSQNPDKPKFKPFLRWKRKFSKLFKKKRTVKIIDPEKLAANIALRNFNPNPELQSSETSDQIRTVHLYKSRRVYYHKQPQITGKNAEDKKSDIPDKESFISVAIIKNIMSNLDLRAIVNSAGLFILSYLFVYLLYQFATIFTASFYGIDSVLYYYEVYFPIGNSSKFWTQSNIIAITLAGPLICGILSLLIFKAVDLNKVTHHGLRLFLLWVAYQGAAHFLGAFTAGIITNLGFGYVPNWLFINVFFKILISLIFLFLLSFIGYYSTPLAIGNLPIGKHKGEGRIAGLISSYLMPWILGTAVLYLVKIPLKVPQHEYIHDYDTIILVSIVFAIIPVIFRTQFLKIPANLRVRRISYNRGLLTLSAAVATLILFRFFLERGIHFIIRFSFNMGFYE